jgi:adenylate kinase family enzyme
VIYKEQTFPVIEFVEREGISLTRIHGETSIAEVFNEIVNVLETKK